MKTRPSVSLLFAALVSCGAAGAAYAQTPPEADRQAILSMQGEYRVRFAFQETVPLVAGYQRAAPYSPGATEAVVVLEDTPTRIVLQHLLVHGGGVTKHWRQAWHYQAARRWEFVADRTWRWRDVPPARVAGSWTQCVYEVSDAPRYCGTGHWQHENGIATWTSDATWRPLPRREYSQRSDYNVLAAVNRHTVTPEGWSHEQDNTKTLRDAQGRVTGQLVREFGFNEYRRVSAAAETGAEAAARPVNFAPAYEYWRRTEGYWARVRARWAARLADPHGVQLLTPVDGMALIEPLFGQAKTVFDGGAVADAELDAVFAQWVAPRRPTE